MEFIATEGVEDCNLHVVCPVSTNAINLMCTNGRSNRTSCPTTLGCARHTKEEDLPQKAVDMDQWIFLRWRLVQVSGVMGIRQEDGVERER